MKENIMKLYHGTSEENAIHILKNGILPRVITKTKHTFPYMNMEEIIYLTNNQPSLYGWHRSIRDNCSKVAIFEIDVEKLQKENFVIDDVLLEELLRDKHQIDTEIYQEKLNYYHVVIRQETITTDLNVLLSFNGNVGYKDIIPVSAITKLCLVNNDVCIPFSFGCIETEISHLNYHIHKEKYYSLNKWLFDEIEHPTFKPWEENMFNLSYDSNSKILYNIRELVT